MDLIPQEFVVSFLEDAPNPNGIMSSKASGEPALMTSVSALMALQQAAAAAILELSHGRARQQSGLQQGDKSGRGWNMLTAPATPHKIKRHLGAFSIADMLELSSST
jgi:xanthine dehydrogenase molybdopterin-binding subunit B